MDELNNNNLPVQASNADTITFSLSIQDVKSLAGWATFVAIIDIIIGALACLSIIGAAYGVTQIISATKLFSATDNLKKYIATNNLSMVSDAFSNMQKYFKLRGITTIIKIALGIVGIILYVIIIIAVISAASSSFSSSNWY